MLTYRLITLKEVELIVSLKKSAIYMLMHKGIFPKPIRIGARAVRWRSDELEHYLETRARAGQYCS